MSQVLDQAPAQMDTGRPRLPIDRVFSLTGFGTVVTGTLIGGSLKEGQEVELQPKGLKARIRSLQSHKHKRKQVDPGGRVAINFSGLEKADVVRGDVVTLPGQWISTKVIDVYFRHLKDLDKPLVHNQEVKFFHGSAQRMAKLRLIGQAQIAPGEEGWIQLILSDEIVADRGDRYILRRPSPGATLGGGQVIDPHPVKRYRLKDRSPIERLEKLLAGDPADVVMEIVKKQGPMRLRETIQGAELDADRGLGIVQALIDRGELLTLGNGEDPSEWFLIARPMWETAKRQSEDILQTFHQQHPLRPGMPAEEYRKRMKLDPKWSSRFLQAATSAGWLSAGSNFVQLPTHKSRLSEKQEQAVNSLLRNFLAQPFNTPSRREVLEVVGEEVLQYLLREEHLVSLNEDVLLATTTYTEAINRIRATLLTQGTVTVAEVRDLLNTSRKYALALMEHLDAIGQTIRDGDVRRLKG
ncbi:MAG: selenocysteine-specific translation factor [Anaerolineales bacterium]|nr:MAG: selenocysteine-specific translation factor [Anaerolineales bacterium]